MTSGRSILSCALVLAATSHLAGASAATPAKVSGATALALAGVIAPLSPNLTGAEKKAVAMLFAANADIPYKKAIVVTADRIVCRTGNVDITVRNCEVTFGKKVKTVNGSTANEIFVPNGRPVHLVLETKDVLHSFWIPQLSGKRDLIANHTNHIWFTPDVNTPSTVWNRCSRVSSDQA